MVRRGSGLRSFARVGSVVAGGAPQRLRVDLPRAEFRVPHAWVRLNSIYKYIVITLGGV